MATADGQAAERIVDLVLGDLRLGGRMFIGRRPQEDTPGTIVIQAGEDGRYPLALPDLGTDSGVEAFVAEVQVVVGEVYGQPVPRCPEHDHALVARVRGEELSWACPEGGWRCSAGDYEELMWPPGAAAGGVPETISRRLARRGIDGLRTIGAELVEGRWVARIEAWPVTEALSEELGAALAPMGFVVTPRAPAPPDAHQKALDRRFESELEWARWAVARWDGFPVDLVPRPLVLAGQPFVGGRGFRSGEAKWAFLHGRFEAEAEVPEPVLALLPARRPMPGAMSEPPPLRITGAVRSEAEFSTDRGRRTLPAWRLELDGCDGPMFVLDPDIAATAWAPEEPPSVPPPPLQSPGRDPGSRIELSPDGRTAAYAFTGARPEYEQYPRAEVIESDRAVAIVPVGVDVGPPGFRILPGYGHEVVVRLRRPLGARVFVDVHGHAGEAVIADSAARQAAFAGAS